MRERTYFLPVFFVSLFIILLLILFATFGWLGFIANSVQGIFFPIGEISQPIGQSKDNSELGKLKKENAALLVQLAQQNSLKADNKALHDQFQTNVPSPKNLLPEKIVGMPGVIPHITFPETYIINGGISEGIGPGSVVIVGQELVGIVAKSSSHFSVVQLVSANRTSFSVKTSSTNAIGILKGQGNGEMIMDNVLLSDELKNGDIVMSMGSQDESGHGVPPDLVVGKIISIEKNPSSLFQQARIVPLVSFDQLQTIFIIKQ